MRREGGTGAATKKTRSVNRGAGESAQTEQKQKDTNLLVFSLAPAFRSASHQSSERALFLIVLTVPATDDGKQASARTRRRQKTRTKVDVSMVKERDAIMRLGFYYAPCVGAAVEPPDDVVVLRQHVGQLALALVAPLPA